MNRIKTSSLQGLEYFVEHLPAAHDEWLWAELGPLLHAGAFWKLAQGAGQVRGAWYAAAGRLLARFPTAFGPAHGARLLRLLLDGAQQPAAAAAPPLWGCLLQLMHHAQVATPPTIRDTIRDRAFTTCALCFRTGQHI